ncbi:family 20 glycosylhydrolase [Cohnella soli]|uniref:Family 20 glycosylhydrolase n=1 Tax=Cohnella soli TaxID=425005 RepID=A0ABW0I0R5_9BACL
MMNMLNRYEKLENDGAYLTIDTSITSGSSLLNHIVRESLSERADVNGYTNVRFVQHMDDELIDILRTNFGDVSVDDTDGFAIVTDENVTVYAASFRGLLYGAYTIRQQAEDGFLRKGIVYNTPLCSFRALKVYLPAENDMVFFRSFVDMACYYRYNTIVIEVGGAMEYKRHPEINEAWVEYCKEMREYSGKSTAIQTGYNWDKNSIHSENGGGRWLSQETVKQLVAYCKDRGLDVIPEVPSLSHSDYLLTAHPELAERAYDPYPDALCPSNPATYELLFDVLDEVVETFEPKVVHVGHDELYSVALCERCKTRDAADLFAEDLTKIHDHLAAKGIKTMMWADKLLNGISKNGGVYGGAARVTTNKEGKFKQFIPPTYPAIDRISKDIQVMHWHWIVRREHDLDLLSRGLYAVFGNLEGPAIPDWSERIARGFRGTGISNWSALQEEYVQRNGIFFNLVYCCRMMWKEGYEEQAFDTLAGETFEELFRYKNRTTLSDPHIEITHATTFNRKFEWFFDGVFVDPNRDQLGEHRLTFEDGTTLIVPANYGVNISSLNLSWERSMHEEFDMYEFDRSLLEASYTARPSREGNNTWYTIVVANPYPDKKLTGFAFTPKPGLDADVVAVKSVQLKP